MEISWTEVLKIALGVIAALGGGGAIVAGLSSWLGKVWADRLMVEEKVKYEKELERLAKQLERKNYVSKVRFDAEFAIYRELSKAFFNAVLAQNDLLSLQQAIDVDLNKTTNMNIDNDKCEKFCAAYNFALDVLHQNAPFIDEELFEQFNSILRDLELQLIWYPLLFTNDSNVLKTEEYDKEFKNFLKRSTAITEKKKQLFTTLRKYLKTLDVVNEN